ncbi:MAG TPA: hypothetical protein VGL62_01765, partial [Vicinamibacterales bacterium]
MRVRTPQILLACALAIGATTLITAQMPAAKPVTSKLTPARSKLTIDTLVHIKHPSGHQWAPDGRHVAWTYDDGGVN